MRNNFLKLQLAILWHWVSNGQTFLTESNFSSLRRRLHRDHIARPDVIPRFWNGVRSVPPVPTDVILVPL